MSFNLPRILNNLTCEIQKRDNKIQNITATEGDTKISGHLDNIPHSIESIAITGGFIGETINENNSFGFTFKITRNIQITKIGILVEQWTNETTSIAYNIYNVNKVQIASYTINKSTKFKNHYITNINPFNLEAGVYNVSLGLTTGMQRNIGVSTYSDIFPTFYGAETSRYQTPKEGGVALSFLNSSGNGNFWFNYFVNASITTESITTNFINNLKPAGGVYMMIAPEPSGLQNTLIEQNVFLNSGFLGTLTFLANTITFSTYTMYFSGLIGALDIETSFVLKIKFNELVLCELPLNILTQTDKVFDCNIKMSFSSKFSSMFLVSVVMNFEYENKKFKSKETTPIQVHVDNTLNITGRWTTVPSFGLFQVNNAYLEKNF